MIVLSIISLINISWHIASYYVKSHVCMLYLGSHLHFTILYALLIMALQVAQLTACTHLLVALENLQQ